MRKLSRSGYPKAFTLPEILTVMGIVGVLTAIAIPAYSGLTGKVQDVEATDFVESLNRAVLSFGQGNWDIPTVANNAATTDEFLVLRSIQYKWPAISLKPGSPYFSPKYNPAASSSSTVHRIRWNGRTFDLIKPGTTGSGLLKTFTGVDYTAADCVFPANYKPAGML